MEEEEEEGEGVEGNVSLRIENGWEEERRMNGGSGTIIQRAAAIKQLSLFLPLSLSLIIQSGVCAGGERTAAGRVVITSNQDDR